MAKPKPVPESSSRESPVFWRKNQDASFKRRERTLEQFARFARWDRGDLRDVVDPKNIEDNLRWQGGLNNMLHLVTRASLADLLFRWPQFVVSSPYEPPPPPPPVPGMPPAPPPLPTLFNSTLARCQTQRLAYIIRRVNYLAKARRALQDTLLGGMGILKITADQEVVVDEDVFAAAQQEAQQELVDFLAHGVMMKAKEDQIHSIHVSIKGQALKQAEQGAIQLPKSAIKYLRNHIAFHERMKWSERPTDTVRSNLIRVRRVNQLDYFYDSTVDDREDATWRGCRFLMRKADILANEDYDEQARLECMETQDRWESRPFGPNVLSPGSFDSSDTMVMVNEMFDLVEQRRYLYADGATVCLIAGQDRGDLAFLQPSGPFEELVFIEDTMEGSAVAPPAGWESEQAAGTAISSANVRAAIQGAGKTVFNEHDIDPAEARKIWEGNTGEFIGINPKGDPKKALADCFAQSPFPEIPEQNLAILMDMVRGIERRSGMGAAKTGGGEESPTATGAALGAEASGAISEDRGALVDAWQERTGRHIVRLDRRFTPHSDWVDVCGDEAITAVPERFTLLDSANDIAVEIVPGSSRRHNTNVDQKQALDLVTAIAPLPMMQGPEGQRVVLQMVRRIADDGGLVGISWTGLEQEVTLMAQMQQMQMQGGPGGPGDEDEAGGPPESSEGAEPPGGPGNGPVGPAHDHPPSETMGVSGNDIHQGVTNAGAGAGQVPTGASTGDKIRAFRGTAVKNVAGRTQ